MSATIKIIQFAVLASTFLQVPIDASKTERIVLHGRFDARVTMENRTLEYLSWEVK